MIANIELTLSVLLICGFALMGAATLIQSWQHTKHLKKLKEQAQEHQRRSKIL